MPTGEGNEYQTRGLEYGSAVTGGNVDFAEDGNLESPGGRDKALLEKLKDALKPADAKRRAEATAASASTSTSTSASDATDDGCRGGIEQTMQSGRRRSDNNNNNNNNNNSGGGLMETLKHKTGFGSNTGTGAGAGTGGGGGGGGGGVVGVREPYRDSTHIDKADDQRVPGNTYRSIRDDLFK